MRRTSFTRPIIDTNTIRRTDIISLEVFGVVFAPHCATPTHSCIKLSPHHAIRPVNVPHFIPPRTPRANPKKRKKGKKHSRIRHRRDIPHHLPCVPLHLPLLARELLLCDPSQGFLDDLQSVPIRSVSFDHLFPQFSKAYCKAFYRHEASVAGLGRNGGRLTSVTSDKITLNPFCAATCAIPAPIHHISQAPRDYAWTAHGRTHQPSAEDCEILDHV